MDILGKVEAYVKLQLVNTLVSKKTHTKMNTLKPWMEWAFEASGLDIIWAILDVTSNNEENI